MVELHDRGRLDALESLIEPDDLVPIGRLGIGGLRMNRRDRRLKRIGPEAARRKRTLDERQAFVDLVAIPEATILIVEQHDLAVGCRARRAPRFMQQHQREQAHRFGLGQQVDEQPAEPDCFARQVDAGQRRPRRRKIAFVEDEIDDAQDAVEALRQFLRRRHFVGNARVANLCLGAHDTLRERRRTAQERLRDLFRRESTDLPKRQRDLRIGRERRMAAREDETQPIVFDAFIVRRSGFVDDVLDMLRVVLDRIEARAAADGVDGLEAARRDEPRAWIVRDPVARPLLERGAKCVVQRLLGDVEIAEQTDQRCEDAARFGAIDGLRDRAHAFSRIVVHRLFQDSGRTSRLATLRRRRSMGLLRLQRQLSLMHRRGVRRTMTPSMTSSSRSQWR